jgi:cytochrome P450
MSADHQPVIEFDHHSKEFAEESVRRFPTMRAGRCPLGHTDSHGGFWVASSYELARQVLSDDEHFTVELSEDRTRGGKLIPTSSKAPVIIPGILDGEPHDRLRRPLKSMFGKANIEATAGPIARRLADELLEGLISRDVFDFAEEFSFRLTVGTIFELVGLDVEVADKGKFILMLEDAFAIDPEIGADRDKLAQSTSGQFAEAEALVRQAVRSRASEPREDLLSKMIDKSTGLTEDDVVALALSIVLGGVRTTAASLDNFIYHLAHQPVLRQELADDPSQILYAVDELMRLYTATPLVARTVTSEVQLGETMLQPGERVAAFMALANLDENQFPEPQEVQLERRNGLHLSFGIGKHYCLGIWLAKLELRTALTAVLSTMPNYSVVDDEARRYKRLGVNNGWSTLPVRPNV